MIITLIASIYIYIYNNERLRGLFWSFLLPSWIFCHFYNEIFLVWCNLTSFAWAYFDLAQFGTTSYLINSHTDCGSGKLAFFRIACPAFFIGLYMALSYLVSRKAFKRAMHNLASTNSMGKSNINYFGKHA